MANYTLSAKLTADARDFIKGLQNAKGEMSKLERFSQNTGKKFQDFGLRVGAIGDGLTNKITKPAMIAGGAVAGLVGTLGFKRLVGMDEAQAKLKGLGFEGKAVDAIMKDVKEAVTGTTHTMAEGVDVAAGALAAGVKEGAELERYIKLVGDAATGANMPMSEMAQIFNRVQGTGKLTRNELDMIEYRLPGFSKAMTKHVGADSLDAFYEMVRSGEVGTDEFLDVMNDFAGGMADAYAGTWSGMVKNTLANIGIIGEALLDGLFKDGKKGLSNFLEVLRSDGLKEWATETGEKIRELAHTVIDFAKTAKGYWDSLSPAIQSFLTKVAIVGSVVAVAIGPALKIIGMLSSAIGFIVPIVGKVATMFGKLGGVVTLLTNPITWIVVAIGLFIGALVLAYNKLDTFRQVVQNTFQAVWDTVSIAISAVSDFIMDIWGGIVDWWHENNELIQQTSEKVWGFIEEVISKTMEFIVPVVEHAWERIKLVTSIVWEFLKHGIGVFMDVLLGAIKVGMQLINGDWKGAWETVKEIGSKVLDRTRILMSNIVDKIKNALSDKFNEAKQKIIDKVEEAKLGAINKFEEMKSNVTAKASEIVNSVKKKFNEAKEKITKPIEDAKKTISDIVDDIKGFFSGLSLKFPSIKMPKLPRFSLSGSFSLAPPSVPKLNVSWHAKGGLMTKPTIFGMAGNTLLGGGEAGPEAILPLNSKVLAGIGKGIESTMRVERESPQPTNVNRGDIVFNVDGYELARIQGPHLDNMFGNDIDLTGYMRGER